MKEPVLLTDSQKKEMVTMYESGVSVQECARVFKVEATTVRKWIKAAGVPIRPMKLAKRQYHCDDLAFSHSNALCSYWLGFLLADGCIFKYESGSICLSVAQSEKDILHLEKLKLFLKAEHPIRSDHKTHSVSLRILSDQLCNDLIIRGCTPRKSNTLVYPASGYLYKRHFIRGYFDGDGTIFINEKQYCFPTVSFVGTFEFLDKLQEILTLEAGVNANAIRDHPHSQAKYLSYGGRGNTKKLYDYFYAEGGTYLERKKLRFEYALSYHKRKLL